MRIGALSAANLGDVLTGDIDPNSGDTMVDPQSVPCMPTGSMGPLSPGQVWCATQSTTLPQVTNTSWLVLGGIAVAFLFIGGRK